MKDNKKILTKADVGLPYQPANTRDFDHEYSSISDMWSDNSKDWKDAYIEGNQIQPILRAIYIGNVRFDECPIFELDIKDGYYKIIGDPEFQYAKELVERQEFY